MYCTQQCGQEGVRGECSPCRSLPDVLQRNGPITSHHITQFHMLVSPITLVISLRCCCCYCRCRRCCCW